MRKPVSATVKTTPQANKTVNCKQINGANLSSCAAFTYTPRHDRWGMTSNNSGEARKRKQTDFGTLTSKNTPITTAKTLNP